jgi:pilus assembly protein CpaB
MIRFIPSQRWLMIAVTLAAGLLAAWSARHHIQGRIEQIEAQSRVPTVARLVAAYDLAAGTRLDADYVAVRNIPAQWAASGALAPEAFAEHAGSVLAHGVQRGEPILDAHLAKEKPEPLSRRVQTGRRAITIAVDDLSSLSGMLQAGDLVDLYVSFEHRRRRVTAPLLQGVLVLATGHQAAEEGGAATSFSTITLDAGPQDAVKLVSARQSGTITAILRHHRDGTPATAAAGGDLASLLGIDNEQAAPARVVQVLYGDQVGNGDTAPADEEPGSRALPSGLFDAAVPQALVSARSRPSHDIHRAAPDPSEHGVERIHAAVGPGAPTP